ncbi:hypothetical protein [Actinotalea sp. K2]|uniref:hypothetical protein n=1 Tax=Actinotalea sp. K2 TaxID=2939438 RepID=UPI002016A9A4|nr:hypothetical protein [Actinotalea sp. K2]
MSEPGPVRKVRGPIVAERYTDWDAHRRDLKSVRATADETSDLDALLEVERHLSQGEQGDGHQPQ